MRMNHSRITLCVLVIAATCIGCRDFGSPVMGVDDDTPALVSFTDDVLPIFVTRCAKSGCHVGATPVVGLGLDSFAALEARNMTTNRRIYVPGQAIKSLLVYRIEGTLGIRMPLDGPPFLPDEQIQLIRDWIDEGALDN